MNLPLLAIPHFAGQGRLKICGTDIQCFKRRSPVGSDSPGRERCVYVGLEINQFEGCITRRNSQGDTSCANPHANPTHLQNEPPTPRNPTLWYAPPSLPLPTLLSKS
ncbi:unnamed protein product [Rhizoctonia solani]|uniref:Uncharacterized protein n=1 Tax=Rhizoctonia solani TaxID=456999 RepID=A0A8H3CUV6_9AGAM|nr:unnamed protein product [Rhizoctonia solani]